MKSGKVPASTRARASAAASASEGPLCSSLRTCQQPFRTRYV